MMAASIYERGDMREILVGNDERIGYLGEQMQMFKSLSLICVGESMNPQAITHSPGVPSNSGRREGPLGTGLNMIAENRFLGMGKRRATPPIESSLVARQPPPRTEFKSFLKLRFRAGMTVRAGQIRNPWHRVRV